jgi:hypothetical protein
VTDNRELEVTVLQGRSRQVSSQMPSVLILTVHLRASLILPVGPDVRERRSLVLIASGLARLEIIPEGRLAVRRPITVFLLISAPWLHFSREVGPRAPLVRISAKGASELSSR